MFILKRYQDWPERLHHFLCAVETQKFVWGKSDCALFAADSVRILTGVDFADDLRGEYSTAAEALLALAKAGYSDLLEIVTDFLGLPMTSVLRLSRGDIVALHCPESVFRYALGVVDMNGKIAMMKDDGGLVRVPLTQASFGWRV